MFRSLIVLFSLVSILATGQSNLLKIDTLWIHKADPNDEDMDSYFPILNSSAKPAIAHNVNTASNAGTGIYPYQLRKSHAA